MSLFHQETMSSILSRSHHPSTWQCLSHCLACSRIGIGNRARRQVGEKMGFRQKQNPICILGRFDFMVTTLARSAAVKIICPLRRSVGGLRLHRMEKCCIDIFPVRKKVLVNNPAKRWLHCFQSHSRRCPPVRQRRNESVNGRQYSRTQMSDSAYTYRQFVENRHAHTEASTG